MCEQRTVEDWRILCELASKEQDGAKLMKLIDRLSRALDRSLLAPVEAEHAGEAGTAL